MGTAQTRTWVLHNIGNGPALDVVILQLVDARWTHPLRMPEMAAGGAHIVPARWAQPDPPALGARYHSVSGELYTTITRDDVSRVREGLGDMPVEFGTTIEAHWRYWSKDNEDPESSS